MNRVWAQIGAPKSVSFEPGGAIPNDSINGIRAERLVGHEAKYLVVMSIDSVDGSGNSTEVKIKVYADSIALEDPRTPGRRITA